jgi:DNA-binding NarL/FixJ family response regulator
MKNSPRLAFTAMNKMHGSLNSDVLSVHEREVTLLAANGVSVFSAMNQVQDPPNVDVLSVREREAMLLAAKGLANKVIARGLNVAEGTVKAHLHRVYQKLGIKGRFALAAWVGNLSPQTETQNSHSASRKMMLSALQEPDASD